MANIDGQYMCMSMMRSSSEAGRSFGRGPCAQLQRKGAHAYRA